MRVFKHFSIPIRGLKNGSHMYQYNIDDEFLAQFENEAIKSGQLHLELELEKKSDHSELIFNINGYIGTECDRCTSEIELNIADQHKLLIKYDAEERLEDEVWFITQDTPEINIAKILYEFISLSVPMIKTYNCEDDNYPPCNMEVLNKLGIEETQEEDGNNPFSKVLKNIKLK